MAADIGIASEPKHDRIGPCPIAHHGRGWLLAFFVGDWRNGANARPDTIRPVNEDPFSTK